MSENILIAGCGDVGNALAARLLAEGCTVYGVRRNVDALASGITPWRVDLRDTASLADPPAAFEYVFFTASADRRDEEAYRTIYVDALEGLLGALRASGAPLKRVFFTSSTAVYGQSNGEWVDERSSTEPNGFNGRILLEAEAVMNRAPERGVNVRLSGIYGPGRTRLVRKVWSGEARATESWTNRIHVDDCAGVLHHLMRLEEPDALYLGSDDLPATTAEVVRWMAGTLGVEAPPEEAAGRLNKRCRNTRLRESGFCFRYPSYQEGYPEIAEAFLRAQRR